MSSLTDILSWVLWLIGILGVGGAIAFIAFVPGGLLLLTEFLRPWATIAGQGTAWFFKRRIEGLYNILFTDIKTTVTALIVSAMLFFGGYQYHKYTSPEIAESVRIDYRLVKRTPAEKKAYLKTKGYSEIGAWWRSWF